MMRFTRGRLVPLSILALFAAAVLAASGLGRAQTTAAVGDPGSAAALAPTDNQSKTTKEVVRRLEREHYRAVPLDDALSGQVLDRFLEALDGTKSYLLASDVREFEKFRTTLDDSLEKGDLGPAFEIFNRYEERVIARLEALVAHIDAGLGDLRFDTDESLELDRRDAPWLKDMKEADDLWNRRLKNDVLSLKVTGKSVEEIQETLSRRYKNRLNRVRQTKSQDAFLVFLSAFTQTFDPHTEYFAPPEAENFDIQMKLSFEGIGALLQLEDEYTKVSRIIPGGPAEASGLLHASDRIIGVGQGTDGEMVDIVGWRLDEVVNLIRGPKGTIVRLAIIPAGSTSDEQSKVIEITRGTVKLEEQAARKETFELDHDDKKFKVGVVRLPAFYIDFQGANSGTDDYKSSTRDVKNLVEELVADGIDALVVDLRGNGGGSLREAKELTGLFIRSGPIVQVRDARDRVQILGDGDGEAVYDGPLAVMVDRLSASASEIFAGAIQDYGRGIVVGEPTFGKGTVQFIAPVTLGQLKFTQSKFYRISGGSTQHRGVIPDIRFPDRYDPSEIGESSLDNALPWDEIDPARFTRTRAVELLLPDLVARHAERVKEDPDFQFRRDRLTYMDEMRAKKTISLNEEKRSREREAEEARWLAIVNRWRVAKGEEPLESPEALEAEAEADTPSDAEPGAAGGKLVDAFVRETGMILLDYANLARERFAKR